MYHYVLTKSTFEFSINIQLFQTRVPFFHHPGFLTFASLFLLVMTLKFQIVHFGMFTNWCIFDIILKAILFGMNYL